MVQLTAQMEDTACGKYNRVLEKEKLSYEKHKILSKVCNVNAIKCGVGIFQGKAKEKNYILIRRILIF